MTHRPLRRVEADGTRVYYSYHRYTPLRPEERKYGINKPEDPRAVRFHGKWFVPLEMLPDDERGPVPATRPDSDAYDHMNRTALCNCDVCRRPAAEKERRRWRKHHGLAP